MSPTIAIVGRPNVGKSTLFNRLTARRTALVSDMPGLTRDRREGGAEIAGHKVKLIDTAGLEEAAPGTIGARMRAQSETAIMQADLVLFLLDARDGVMPADAAFARVVRGSGRPVILVANKCEGRAGADGFYEAFQLGLGEPIAISAEHGEGIADLIEAMLAALALKPQRTRKDAAGGEPGEQGIGKSHPIRIAIVGRPNSGKSTLVNALLGEERMITGPEPGLTRDAVATDFAWRNRPIRIFDTAGLRRKARISEVAEKLAASDAVRAIRFAEVVVVLIDAEHAFEHQDLTIAQEAQGAEGDGRGAADAGRRCSARRHLGAGRSRPRQADGRGDAQLRDLEPQGSDARAQPLARRGARAARSASLQGPAHQDPLHDPAVGPAADVHWFLHARRSPAEGLSALSRQ
jgi:GTPase